MAFPGSSNKAICYQPLDGTRKEIRLLSMQAGCDDDPIQCTLHHAFLDGDSKPKYETISYCWGDPAKRGSVFVDKNVVSVPKSAEAALRRMRVRDCNRVLWIDSVCINQNDLLERKRQVQLMVDVYRTGHGNLIHLGEDGAMAEKAFHGIHMIHQDASKETGGFTRSDKTVKDRFSGYSTAPLIVEFDPDALLNFLNCAWFRRLWVLQEAALSARNTIFYGNTHKDFAQVIQAGQWMFSKRRSLPALVAYSAGFRNLVILGDFIASRRTGKPFLESLLREAGYFEVSEPRDRVFGMLGLYQWISGLPEVPPVLLPNYTKPVSDVFLQATRYAIVESRTLNLWNIPTRHGELQLSQSLPSWVTNWYNILCAEDEKSRTPELPHFHNACSSAEALRHVLIEDSDVDERTLVVKGFEADTVQEVTNVLTYQTLISASLLLLWLTEALRLAAELIQSHENSITTVGVTLIAGQTWLRQHASTHDAMAVSDLLTFLERHGALPPKIQHQTEDLGNFQAASSYAESLSRICRNRRFFTTRAGRIGIGPSSINRGDIVAVVAGGKLPCVLRQTTLNHAEGYQLDGAAYVHGIMGGEASEGHLQRGLPLKRFRIV